MSKAKITVKEAKDLKNENEVITHIKASRMVSFLQYCNDEIKNNKNIFTEATKVYPGSIAYASEDLRNDKEFALELLELNSESIVGFSDKFKDDFEIIFKALSNAKDRVVMCWKLQDISSNRVKQAFKDTVTISEAEKNLIKCMEMERNGFRVSEGNLPKQIESYHLIFDLNNSLQDTKEIKPKKPKV